MEAATRRSMFAWALPGTFLSKVILVGGLVLAAVTARLLWHRFLDPFEDGYQQWWIASLFVETGVYSDPFSGMTRGNWLPGYSFFLAGLVGSFGSHIMPLMKAANTLFSLGTAGLIYLIARPYGRLTAGLAATLFVLSPADIVISSFATPEALALLATFSGVFFMERRPFAQRTSLTFATLAFVLAATLRYEVWGFVAVYLLLTWHGRRINRRELVFLASPIIVFAAVWWLWTTQYGFLPAMIIGQTSTDVQYKASAGTLAPLSERLTSFFFWYLAWTPFALVAIVWAMLKERKSSFTWILCMFYGAEVVYTAAGFGNPGPRYIHLTIPIVCINSAIGLVTLGRWLSREHGPLRWTHGWAPVVAALAVSLLLTVQVLNSSPPPGFLLGGMKRAGEFLESHPLPDGKILISESPIAAYYSGYPASRVFGSSTLPMDAMNASEFLVGNAAYVILVTVPYYRLRQLFPDQANGANGNHLVLLYDATGVEYDFGAPRVLVFEVIP